MRVTGDTDVISPRSARNDGAPPLPLRERDEQLRPGEPVPIITVGHGLLDAPSFASLLRVAGVGSLVDVRTAPGSRRNPAFARAELERWLPRHGIAYRWEPRLGGFRRPAADTPDVALRHEGFRGYAGHMRTSEFAEAIDELMRGAATGGRTAPSGDECALTTVMCSESVWWRCHRRLIADNLVLSRQAEVRHLMHDGRLVVHALTDGVRLADDGRLVYDGGTPRLPGT